MCGRVQMTEYSILICVLVVVVACIIVRHYRKESEQTMHFVLDTLDRSLRGERITYEYNESMNSAICDRLDRIIQMNDMQKKEAQKERDNVKSLVSDISHQIRTPLSNIVLYAGLLKEQAQDDNTVQLVDRIQAQSDKLDFLIKELVKSSRIEQEIIQVQCFRLSIFSIVTSAIQNIEMKALKKNITISYDEIQSDVSADEQWSMEAIVNVIDNAIKYSPCASTIYIKTRQLESFVCLEILDEGIGIDEQQQGLIFQRFYRVPMENSTQGFGIGLYLVREVMSKQGGYVRVSSKLSQGSCFQLYFKRYTV